MIAQDLLKHSDDFVRRHLGSNEAEIQEMLAFLGYESLDALADATIPENIRVDRPIDVPVARADHELLTALRAMASKNEIRRSHIGMGYYGCFTPPVILRNVLENPGWYTQYTPYQAEISQGRLEALLTFQTMVSDLTALPLANSSLLDEGTAAAEAMNMCRSVALQNRKKNARVFYAADNCHPQTLAVMQTRAVPLGIELRVGPLSEIDFDAGDLFGVLVQYPTTDGRVEDYSALADRVHEAGALLVVATDLLALTLLRPPGEFGADVAVGSSQRFGVPLGYGGPHAGFMAARAEYKRHIPGRIIGVSVDAAGKKAYRLALQTREQHIRRDRATSNICTAQVLLAIMASMYAVYHGPDGLRRIASRVRGWTRVLAAGLRGLGLDVGDGLFFDTLRVRTDTAKAKEVLAACDERGINLRVFDDGSLGVSLDETTGAEEVAELLSAFAGKGGESAAIDDYLADGNPEFPAPFERTSDFLAHENFHLYHSEHELLRYMTRLQSRDLSLVTSMIPLGSCTMKLNAAAEMLPITWPEFANLHPFAPAEQAQGYAQLFNDLTKWLGEITGLPGVSLQPNSGAQGEYTGLLVIRAYHASRGDSHRNICLIPASAHGTNPASAVMAGYKMVAVACDKKGNIEVADLEAKAEKHRDNLGALMITYPSTHGVFESAVVKICRTVHEHGGMVYMDGANMNAQVGLCRPGDYGADVCHLNLHKTFAIPHGGGGPGVGPIVANETLTPFLPGHPHLPAREQAIGPVSAAPYGSPSILPISWMYIALMGGAGLKQASQVAVLNANYMAKRLSEHYDVVFTGETGNVAHEFIIDCRQFKKSAGIVVDDIAKRLMDFGFHAPTMSWPVAGTLMIEPTESESKAELDRMCDALIAIREEIRAIEEGAIDRDDNPLKNSPHTAEAVAADEWTRPYGREQAAFPAAWLREYKFWPPVARIDNAYGDRNLVCVCVWPEED